MSTNPVNSIPSRKDIPLSDCWDLSSLFSSFEDFYNAFQALKHLKSEISSFKGKPSASPIQLATTLEFYFNIEQQSEALSYFAFLKSAQDGQDSQNQDADGKVTQLLSEIQGEFSFLVPEILSIPEQEFLSWLDHPSLLPYNVYLNRVYRYKPHTLSESEEKILSLQSMFSGTPHQAFSSLTNADMSFGSIQTEEGELPLTQSTFGKFRMHENPEIRKKAYQQFFKVFDDHKQTLTTLLHGSVQKDVFDAKIRKFNSSLEARLFTHNIPTSVYTSLIEAVHQNLPVLHRYYEIRKKALKQKTLAIYDTRVSITPKIKVRHSYEEAVDLIIKALKPLGDEYTGILKTGLLNGWVDRYENKGKRSGAFSAGSFKGAPYILMNYKDDLLDDVFTLAHEAGHSMHSYYSSRHQSFQDYQYTIFVAEVASTFNERLLADYLIHHTDDPKFKALLINKQVDDIVATLFRQTMFAEFELKTHQAVESGQPLTLDFVRSLYRGLLETYFGKNVELDPLSDLEGFYIPHFYSAFYVYQYATGISAAIALSNGVLNAENDGPLNAYLDFLKNGGRSFPLDQLRSAGVDMSTPRPVNEALLIFKDLVDSLESLLNI